MPLNMAQTVCPLVSAADRQRLAAILADRNRPQKHVALTCGEPPGETTHWTGRMMAKAAGLSLRTVQRICVPVHGFETPLWTCFGRVESGFGFTRPASRTEAGS